MNTSNSAPLGPDVCAVPRRKLFASAAAVEEFFSFLLETFSVDFFPVPGSFMGRVRDMKTRKLCLAEVSDFFFAFARRRGFARITSCSHVVSEFWLLIKYANFSAFKLACSQVPSRLLIAFDNPAHGELIRNVYRSGWF